MIIVVLKTGYAFSFEMVSWDKEKLLVEKFNSGNLSPTTILDLKSKGTYKVDDIQEMNFQAVKVIKKEVKKEPSKDEKFKDFMSTIQKAKKEREEQRIKEVYDILRGKKS